MANRYWVGNGGTWNSSDTTHWSDTSGGAGGASVPTSADTVYFNANSFSATGQTVLTSGNITCGGMDWTGVTNTPTLQLGGTLIIGSVGLKFVSGMTFTPGTYFVAFSYSAGATLDSGGKTFYGISLPDGSPDVTMLSDVTTTNFTLDDSDSVFRLNGYTLTTNTMTFSAGTLNMTNSTLKCRFFYAYDTTNCTLVSTGSTLNIHTGTTHTINVATTGGGALKFNNLTMISTGTLTINGATSWANLSIPAGKTVNIASGSTHTITGKSVFGDADTASTIKAVTTDSVATLSIASGKYVWAKNCAINDVVISGDGYGYYSDGSTVDAESTGWTAGSPPTGIVLTAVQDGNHIDLSWV